MSNQLTVTDYQGVLNFLESDILKIVLDAMKINYSFMNKDGSYIAQNLSMIKDISAGKLKAQDIDVPSWESCKEVMASGKRAIVEEGFEGRSYLSIKQPLIKNNDVVGIMVFSIDITAQKQAEEREKLAIEQTAEERGKALAEAELRQAVMILAGSIAHDLRTPVATVGLIGSNLKHSFPILMNVYKQAIEANLSVPSLRVKLLEPIPENLCEIAQEMQDFISVTLDTLSKTLRGELTQNDLIPCSMWHCIQNVLARFPFDRGQHKLVDWDGKDFRFLGNEVLMIRIISNLLKNSLEQIDKNQKGEIFITTEENEHSNILRFKDTAGGAPPEIVNHLFEGYRSTKETGTGVGLSFCKLAMKSFNGDITCQSKYGDYIEFLLTFPKLHGQR